MKPAKGVGIGLMRIEPQRLRLVSLVVCILAPLAVLALIRLDVRRLSVMNLRVQILHKDESTALAIEDEVNTSMVYSEFSIAAVLQPVESKVGNLSKEETGTNSSTGMSESKQQDSKLECDVSELRTDVCEVHGDVRIHGTSSSVMLVSSSIQNTSQNIRPYARKWEPPTMSFVKELSLRPVPETKETPRCSMNHSVPAVVFSTGGFQGNFFHELTDVLIPLFLTSRQFHGEVQFLIVDFKPWWITKYQTILRKLSQYEIVNLDMDSRVHCFKHVVVGLRSHKELGIDPMKTPQGYSMIDFRQFLRSSYSLRRDSIRRTEDLQSKKPRLLIMSRKKSRSLLNERKVIRMARGLGYKVIVARPEITGNLSRIARVVNSCDVMMGVHGAGLSNMVFLPTNATVIQIIPWGGLKWACRFAFGDPAVVMGLKYLEYEIGQEESSLIKKYPRDHAVFRDPLSIHRQGFHALWSIFIDKQNVTLHVGRFRSVLLEALQSSHQ